MFFNVLVKTNVNFITCLCISIFRVTIFISFMSNLFLLFDISSKGLLDVYLDITSLFAILFGICVINSKNPIISVLFLIGLFVSISVNLILLGYNFIGLSYLLVYVGAVSILFLFILMLINIRISELLNETNNSIPLAIFTSFSFGFVVYKVLNSIDLIKDKYKNLDLSFLLANENISNNALNHYYNKNTKDLVSESNEIISIKDVINNDDETNLYLSTSNSWDDNLIEFTDITSIGNILYTSYGIWLIICSIILLLAMVGAISITKKERE